MLYLDWINIALVLYYIYLIQVEHGSNIYSIQVEHGSNIYLIQVSKQKMFS
jgi:hypothetical protein